MNERQSANLLRLLSPLPVRRGSHVLMGGGRVRVRVLLVLVAALLLGCAVDQNREVALYRGVLDGANASTQPAFAPDQPLSLQRVSCCDPPADTVYDIRLVRVLTVTMTGPSTLRVGERVELPLATIDLDNDTQRFVYILPSSSDPTVVAVENGQRGFVIRGARPGVAIITFDYHGVSATLQVRVVDQ